MKLEFNEPLKVSSEGYEPDMLLVGFRASDMFISEKNGKSIDENMSVKLKVPKQFKDLTSFNLNEIFSISIVVFIFMIALISLTSTLILHASLKLMWQLNHTIQVVAYLRLVVRWSANINQAM